MKYKVTISKGISGRLWKEDKIEDFEKPKYGFYWWFWIPKYTSNGGRFKYNEVIDVSINWLCFHLGVVFWPNNKR